LLDFLLYVCDIVDGKFFGRADGILRDGICVGEWFVFAVPVSQYTWYKDIFKIMGILSNLLPNCAEYYKIV